MKFIQSLACFFACLLLAATPAFAQGVGSSGDIRGTAIDPSGAVMPKATITAVEVEKGLQRTTVTDLNGQYHFTDLAPTTYNVSAASSGFKTEIQKGVTVNVGQTNIIDFRMQVSQASEQLEVTAVPPTVETEKSQQADTINQQYIRDLPIDRRDYLTYTLLLPGVNDSRTITDNTDFRVRQTPQSGLSFYGSNGRGNNVTVDGGEANDDAGGVRLTLSQDAVQEFQINRSNYSADLGSASGASINIVSKSGTNKVHGSLYSFFRNDALDARDPFAFSQALQAGQAFNPLLQDAQGRPIKSSLSRQQYGGTLGFPIKKDKTFFFGSFEGLRRDAQGAVPLLTNTNIFRPEANAQNNQVAILSGLAARGGSPVPCISNRTGPPTVLPAALCAGLLQNILTVNPATSPLNAFLVNQFETNGGVFPFTSREYLASGRLDHQVNGNNQLNFRYNFGHDREQNPNTQALNAFSRSDAIFQRDNTLQGAWYHQFSPTAQNETRVQWNYSNLNVTPLDPAGASLDIPGFGFFATDIFLPSFTTMRRYEFADNFTLIHGHHTMKMGFDELIRGNRTESHTFFPGRFEFGSLPGGILSPCLQVPAACGLAANSATLNALQSAALGLPQFYQQGFGNPTLKSNAPLTAPFWQDSWTLAPNFTLNYGLRYQIDSGYAPLNNDKDNFAPRISFAWDPFKDHKTVVRAGYGIFYAPIYNQIFNVVKTLGNNNGSRQIANLLVPLTGAPGLSPAVNAAAIFQTLFAQGKVQCTTPAPGNAACITPADLAQFGITVANSGPLPPLTVLFAGAPNYQNPYSQQAELGIEHEIAPGTSVSLSYIYSHSSRLPRAIDTNLLPAPLTSATLANGQTVSFHNWGAPQCQANPFACFANPLLLQNDVYTSSASALYHAGILEIKKRFSQHFTVMGNYTYSKAIDDGTDFNSDYAPFDQANLRAERALSTFDQRHKVVIAGVLDSPWENSRIFSGFELSPIFRYNSGHPFNLLTGSDIFGNNDRHFTNDRPIGAGRNTGLGPNYSSFDMRLTRTFKFGERANMQFLAEGFNIANRTNFASVNNTVSPNFGFTPGFTTFNVSGNRSLSPSQPLGFTAAFPRRELQLGLRFNF